MPTDLPARLRALRRYETQEIESMSGLRGHEDWVRADDLAAALQGSETASPVDNAGDDASREAAKRMSVRGPSSTNPLLADAWWMGRQSAIDRRGHDYRRSPSGPDLQARCEADIQLLLGPAQPEIGGPPNTAERWAARKAARSKAAGAPAPAPHEERGPETYARASEADIAEQAARAEQVPNAPQLAPRWWREKLLRAASGAEANADIVETNEARHFALGQAEAYRHAAAWLPPPPAQEDQ